MNCQCPLKTSPFPLGKASSHTRLHPPLRSGYAWPPPLRSGVILFCRLRAAMIYAAANLVKSDSSLSYNEKKTAALRAGSG